MGGEAGVGLGDALNWQSALIRKDCLSCFPAREVGMWPELDQGCPQPLTESASSLFAGQLIFGRSTMSLFKLITSGRHVFLLIAVLQVSRPVLSEESPPEAPFSTDPLGDNTGRPRLRMTPEILHQTDPRACLTQAAEMATSENLDGFLDCFAMGSQKKLRKEAALLFARHDITMDLIDAHVINESGTKGELAVRYRAKLSDTQYDVVSLVTVRREKGYWKISTEKVKEYECQSPRSCHPSRYTCLGGSCPVVAR